MALSLEVEVVVVVVDIGEHVHRMVMEVRIVIVQL
jgi:PII-like signaling protein